MKVKNYIRNQIEKFISEHNHAKKFFMTVSDWNRDEYFIMCCVCDYSRYIDIVDYEKYVDALSDVMIELEKKYKVEFNAFSCKD